jgi:hypothetical protein
MKPYQVNSEYPPPKAHVINPFDFNLWESLEDMAYHRKPPTLETLREEIETPCAALPLDTLATAACALTRWTQNSLQADSGHFEHMF